MNIAHGEIEYRRKTSQSEETEIHLKKLGRIQEQQQDNNKKCISYMLQSSTFCIMILILATITNFTNFFLHFCIAHRQYIEIGLTLPSRDSQYIK